MKDIFAQAAIDSLKLLSGKARSGGETNSNQRKNTDWVRQELSKILSSDELVVWEEFEANKATHMIEQQYDMQLGMFAVGLTAENRTMVRDVMVDETLLLQQAQLDDDVLTMESRLKAHMEIFQNARQRLFPLLDTDQYTVAEAFIEQQEAGLRIGMQMMDEMFGDEEGADIAEEL